jgi:hypothetical protein
MMVFIAGSAQDRPGIWPCQVQAPERDHSSEQQERSDMETFDPNQFESKPTDPNQPDPGSMDPGQMQPEFEDPTTMEGFPRMFTWREAWTRALTRPREETFIELVNDPTASFTRAATWLFVSSLIATLLFGILWFIGFQLGLMSSLAQQPELAEVLPSGMLAGGFGVAMLCFIPLLALGTVLGIIIQIGIVQFIAGTFGGNGSFTDLFYATSAFYAPFLLLNAVLGLIPFVNFCLTVPLGVYVACLGILSLKAVNQFSWGRAIAVVLTLFLLFALIAVIVGALILGPFMDLLSSMPTQ